MRTGLWVEPGSGRGVETSGSHVNPAARHPTMEEAADRADKTHQPAASVPPELARWDSVCHCIWAEAGVGGSGVGLSQQVGSHTIPLRQRWPAFSGILKHQLKRDSEGWGPHFTMQPAYQSGTSPWRCPPGHQRLGAKGKRRSSATYHGQKPPRGPVLPPLPIGPRSDECPSQKRDSLWPAAQPKFQ